MKTVSLLKPVTLLLIAAIANPMCCCLSFAETDLEATTKAEFDPHACCKVAEEASQSSEATPDGDHDCFHQEIESFQFSDNSGTTQITSAAPVQQIVDHVDANSVYLARLAVSLSGSANRPDSFLRQTGISFSQKYCVFTL